MEREGAERLARLQAVRLQESARSVAASRRFQARQAAEKAAAAEQQRVSAVEMAAALDAIRAAARVHVRF